MIAGMVVSLDALYCTSTMAEYLIGRGAHYLIGLKGNQKTLAGLAQDVPWDRIGIAFKDDGNGHGRTETRHFKIVEAPDGFDLPGAARIIQVTPERARAGLRRQRPGPVGPEPH